MEIDQIIETIVRNLQKNGFPDSRVSLPKNALEFFVKKHDYELEDVLYEMQQNEVHSKIEEARIIFSADVFSDSQKEEIPEGFDFSALKNMDLSKLKEKAESMMSQMSPEERRRYEDMYAKMSPEERQKIFEQAKSMGLF